MLQNPDAPGNLEKMKAMIAAIFGPESVTNPPITDAAAMLRKERESLAQYAPEYLKQLLAADPAAIRRESEQLYDRAIKEFGDDPMSVLDIPPPPARLWPMLIARRHETGAVHPRRRG